MKQTNKLPTISLFKKTEAVAQRDVSDAHGVGGGRGGFRRWRKNPQLWKVCYLNTTSQYRFITK
jgi:hypothetical protein